MSGSASWHLPIPLLSGCPATVVTMFERVLVSLMAAGAITLAQNNGGSPSNGPAATPSPGQRGQTIKDGAGPTSEQVRTRCIEGRRYIAGRVLQVNRDGIVVDSGYSKLLSPPFNRSWLVSNTV